MRHGKGGKDRNVMLSPQLLGILRTYWRLAKPKMFLFPGRDHSIDPTVLHAACRSAVKAAGLTKRVTLHTLRAGPADSAIKHQEAAERDRQQKFCPGSEFRSPGVKRGTTRRVTLRVPSRMSSRAEEFVYCDRPTLSRQTDYPLKKASPILFPSQPTMHRSIVERVGNLSRMDPSLVANFSNKGLHQPTVLGSKPWQIRSDR